MLRAANGPAAPGSHTSGGSAGSAGGGILATDRVVQDDESHAVAVQRLDLDARHERRHAVEHVGGPEDAIAARHDLVVGEPVARGLAHLVGDQRGGLGLAEAQPAAEPATCQLGRLEQQQSLDLARCQPHGAPPRTR